MKRELNINNPLWGSEPLSIVEVDHFLHRVDAVVWEVNLNNGVGSVELPTLKLGSQNFYMIVEKKHVFTLWDNETEPMLLDDAYFRKIYPVMNGASDDDEMDVLNFNCVLNRYLKGEPIMKKEDERILCEYFSFANGDELRDGQLCAIDRGLIA
jgi:hypothetical protein